MSLEKLKEVVSKAAPILGTVIGGPITGGAIGVGISLLAKAFGSDPGKPDEILKAIQADPYASDKLRELEMKHQETLLQLAVEHEKLMLESSRIDMQREQNVLLDIQSARSREVDITRATGKINWPLYMLAGVIYIGFFTTLGVLFSIQMPGGNSETIWILTGTLASMFTTVTTYFFGSSLGSWVKNFTGKEQQHEK